MLMADPRPADAERLRGYDYSRVTVGEYRIIFDVRGGVLRVVAIGKRNDDEVMARGVQQRQRFLHDRLGLVLTRAGRSG